MSIRLKTEDYASFFKLDENKEMVASYVDELIGHDKSMMHSDEVALAFKDKEFFQIIKANTPIGFGAYTFEPVNGEQAFMLHEFYVMPKFRSLSQLYEIRRQITVALKILDVSLWSCLVDIDEQKNINAYRGLGFKPMFEDNGLLVMGMEVENL